MIGVGKEKINHIHKIAGMNTEICGFVLTLAESISPEIILE